MGADLEMKEELGSIELSEERSFKDVDLKDLLSG